MLTKYSFGARRETRKETRTRLARVLSAGRVAGNKLGSYCQNAGATLRKCPRSILGEVSGRRPPKSVETISQVLLETGRPSSPDQVRQKLAELDQVRVRHRPIVGHIWPSLAAGARISFAIRSLQHNCFPAARPAERSMFRSCVRDAQRAAQEHLFGMCVVLEIARVGVFPGGRMTNRRTGIKLCRRPPRQ